MSYCVVVSLENVVMDISELVKGMEMTRREYEARKDRDPPAILKDFLANSEDKLTKLRADAKTAQVSSATYKWGSEATQPSLSERQFDENERAF